MAQTVQDDVVALLIKTARLTGEQFLNAVEATLQKGISRSPKDKQGRQTLNQLVSDGSKLENIEVSDKNIKSFEASARAYGIKFAVKKVPDQQTYAVFFKGKDIEQVNRAFRHYQKNFGRSKAQERPSVLKEINTINREQQQKNKQRERSREQKKERGMEH